MNQKSKGAIVADKIYVGQTALTLQLDTGIDLSTASSALMKFIRPDKTVGQWVAVIDAPATDGIISYDIASATDLDQSGIWKRWAYITFTGGAVAPGDCVPFEVFDEGASCG